MIVKLKKLTLLCTKEDKEETLIALRNLGVLHLHHLCEPTGESVDAARKQLDRINNALDGLSAVEPSTMEPKTAGEILQEIEDVRNAIDAEMEAKDGLATELERMGPFGDFKPASAESLRQEGLYFALYFSTAFSEIDFGERVCVTVSHTDKHGTWFSVLSDAEQSIEADELPLPKQSQSEIRKSIQSQNETLLALESRLTQLSAHRPVLARESKMAEEHLAFDEADTGMFESDDFAALRGFLPTESVRNVQSLAQSEGWGLVIDEPADKDPVPTLIRNPRWVDLIQPVFNFIGIIPGYREVDISAIFLVFFSIFFGMIVGDAGYGLIFLILTLVLGKKLKAAQPLMFPMMIVMSIMTILWGALTGNYFGILIDHIPAPLARFKIDWLSSDDNLMLLCFTIGAVHLTLAHLWNAIRSMNSLICLAQIGWIGTTWAMYFAARSMILGNEFPGVVYIPLFGGIALITLFMTPVRKIKAEWFNHIVLPLNLVSNFVDVVSYVRLYAVGMATFAVAFAFNDMAMGIGFDGIGSGIGAALILFVGHVLNMALAAMGVLVHGIRLNALEFSGHLGLEWTGIPFIPFKKTSSEE